jgi:hypothetical protein
VQQLPLLEDRGAGPRQGLMQILDLVLLGHHGPTEHEVGHVPQHCRAEQAGDHCGADDGVGVGVREAHRLRPGDQHHRQGEPVTHQR